ncbi:MAG: aldehyde dehydrogenase family protein, partial [Chloroflexi bacterium]|nr:aldehyde dehydrogenase family protein [Chloroflexota bacterium]
MTAWPAIQSVNPATEEVLATFEPFTARQIDERLGGAHAAFLRWRDVPFAERGALMRRVAVHLRTHKADLAGLITAEMGKPVVEAEAEVEKCAWSCEFFAEHAAQFLADQPHPSSAAESSVVFDPLGPVLAIMPWNFPFWQVF